MSTGQSRIRWGFTGSTGDSSESNLVVFDQIPGQTKTTASAGMTCEKDGQQVDVTDDGQTSIPGGSNVTLNYNAQRTSGDTDWKGLNAELKVPDHVTLDGTAKITYEDGSTREATVTKQSDGYANVNLAQDGSADGLTLSGIDGVKIAMGGKAQNPTSGNTYSSGSDLTSYFKGTNAVSTAATPAFTITHEDIPALVLAMDQTQVNVNVGQDAKITGKITTTDGSTLTNSKVVLNPYWAPVGASAATLMSPITLSDQNPASGFSFTFPSNSLSAGTYTLYVFAKDNATNNLTSVIPITVVVGNVAFGSNSGDLTYQSQISGSKQIVERADPDWTFNINDTVTKGTDWQLSAKASALTSDTDGSTLDGQLVYSNDGTNMQQLSPTADTIITDHKSDGSNTPFNIASDWQDNTGILLQLNGGALVGNYQGKVTWTLSNTATTQ